MDTIVPSTSGVVYSSVFSSCYDDAIDGAFRAPKATRYFENPSPLTGWKLYQVAVSDVAHAANEAWGRTSIAERANILDAIAQCMEDTRNRRDLGQQQAGSREQGGGSAAGDRSLSLLRGRHSCPAKLPGGDRRRHALRPRRGCRDSRCEHLYRFARAIETGRVWVNCGHAYPAHATFGGSKDSGIERETHRMMLDHHQQTKNVPVSYSPKTARLL